MSSLDLQDAVMVKLAADADITTMLADGAAGIWADESPEGVDLPWIVVHDRGGAAEYETIDALNKIGYDDTGDIQVSVFAGSRALSKALARLVETSLNDAPLVFDDGSLVSFRRDHTSTELDPDKGPDGVDVWQTVLLFETIASSTI